MNGSINTFKRGLKHRATFPVIALALLLGSLSASAQTLEQITQAREAKLEASLQELHALRESIQAERLPLTRDLNATHAKADELEDEVARVRRLKDSQSVELETLRERVTGRQREVDYVTRTLMPSYLANYEAALSVGELETVGESIREYNLYLENADASEADKLAAGLTLMADSLQQLESLLGGQIYAGNALTPEGTLLAGDFVQVGPLLYFGASDQSTAGFALASRSERADLHPLEDEAAGEIFTVLSSGSGQLPVDPTLGDALAVEQAKDSIPEHLVKGGVWVYPILAFALVATVVSIFKALQVFSVRHPQPLVIHDIIKHLRAGEKPAALELAKAQPQPTREMLVMAVEHADESTEMVEEVMYEAMLTTQPKLERFLNVIAVTAAAAPLLGLLGTVTGIIKTFRLMTVFGAGDPKPLISGISEALITTELGLILAIPALVMHAMLSRKVAGIMARLEKTAVTFVNGLSRSKPE
ncbi:MotA/TolQ/ExbB proton channel family protein [Coraliomargarita sp. SDUM461003]|uniref:MotA/TolQ/ExbB proton channel family protein n=1 Tax=Thalassobacterium maritimum TaxID=3041265 RepID=A0ABU1ASW8_9BACT|nr:MotA/TolQ/ExbB proton channel family protein [Coraliomargarita sp. SDUM461003]MDQ8207186.1 MotA/TolQ/ExbB proton channel family protein [Coraliomargarita sp. SDUM461003]